MKRAVAIILLLCAVGVTAFAKPKKDKTEVNITLDQQGLQGKPEAVTVAWTGYGLARANWVSEYVIGKAQPVRTKAVWSPTPPTGAACSSAVHGAGERLSREQATCPPPAGG